MATRQRRRLFLTLGIATLALAAWFTWRGQPAALAGESRFGLQVVANGLDDPVFLTHAGDGSGRLFVVEQAGRIRVIADGRLLERPFLDLHQVVYSGGELGLLGLAFHPDYARNGRLFVDYTVRRQRQIFTVVSEWRVSADDPQRVDPQSERELLRVQQPYANHNGGMLCFGPDGLLYVGFGDGGAANDPHQNGQNTDTLLGSIVRISVDGPERPYGIPPGNPFAAGGGRPELYAWGLRNPWRFSFDRGQPGHLVVGDVGQDRYEEVDLITGPGANCGWNLMEGFHPFQGGPREGLTAPVWEYDHDVGRSVTGGYVYRGSALPELVGSYLVTDYYPGLVWGLKPGPEGEPWQATPLGQHRFRVSSFGEDAAGELYLVDHGGRILKLVPPTR